MRVEISKRIFNQVYIPSLENSKRYEIIYGGAGSGKSHFVAQKKVYQHLKDRGRKTLIVRKVGKTIKNSTFALIKQTIQGWGLSHVFQVPKGSTNFDILGPGGNQFLFTGLDDVEKLKSIVGITDMWIEEASELFDEDFTQLDLRLRGRTAFPKQITLTFNPISHHSWLKRRFFDMVDEDASILKTTYKDNRFIDEEYKKMIEGLKDKDQVFYSVYALGEWGVMGNLVFTNWTVEDFSFRFHQIYNGLDFGFNDPSALIRVAVKDQEIYIIDELYEKGLTNSDLIEQVKEKVPLNTSIICDSSEPDRIVEFRRAGFNAEPAKKGPDSIRHGLDWLRRMKIHVHPRCVHTIRELQGYKYRETRDGTILDEPVDMNNHLMDALRYAVEPYRLQMLSTQDQNALALLAGAKVY